MTRSLDMKIENALPEALADPGLYPHRPDRVDVRQTHISWVFLAGDLVYKLKKSLRFGFLDYSTPELRLECCRAEVRLNRRLAPSVYLGVLPIVRCGKGFALGSSDPAAARDVVDYVVVMRRLPEGLMLDRCLMRGEAGRAALERLAAKLVAFHAACADRGARYGSPAAVADLVLENFAECARAVAASFGEQCAEGIKSFIHRFVAEHTQVLGDRAIRGRVREGHGDLRAEHVCLTPDIDVFDCVEFSERIRSCDVASEIAFLAMDLDFLGEPALGDFFAASYARIAADPTLAVVLPFYRCYRALVRGKVEYLRSREAEVGEADRESARQASRRYFRLAARYTRGDRNPEIVVVCGLAGTGKSTVARIVGEITGFLVFNSDIVRKDLARIPRFAHVKGEQAASLYSADTTRRTYDALRKHTGDTLRAGRGVVLDATYRDANEKHRLIDLASREHVAIRFLECRASEAEVLRRLAARGARSTEVSDADAVIYRRQRQHARVCDGIPRRVMDTERPMDAVEAEIEALLAEG
jgi:aminoglycoside phosphotransferase family enzyme/predicted kinase